MRRRFLGILASVLFGMMAIAPAVETAQACPMCREANETDSSRPRAYMYSILFMLAVPATVATGFGVGFYRLSKKQRLADELAGGEADADASP